MNRPPYDVAVVGAGIVGAACAEACAQDGLSVIVLEGRGVASGATAAGMGHVVALPGSEEELLLSRYSRDLWRRHIPSLAPTPDAPGGTIWVVETYDDRGVLEQIGDRLSRAGVPASLLNAQELHRLEPRLAGGIPGGLLVPDDLIVDPPTATRALLDSARRRGATIDVGRAAIAVAPGEVTLAGGRLAEATHIIVASGLSSVDLIPPIPLLPRKGHIVSLEVPPGYVSHQIAEAGYLASIRTSADAAVVFDVQPSPGRGFLVGASRQHGRTTSGVEPPIVEALLRRAETYLPGVTRFRRLQSWAGLRPASADHKPFIGPVPGAVGVWIATGHEGLGITCSLATGRLIADQIAGRPTEIPVVPFLPAGRMGAFSPAREASHLLPEDDEALSQGHTDPTRGNLDS